MSDSMKLLDKNMQETEAEQRKKFLILNLNRMGVYQTGYGIHLKHLGLADLEWMYIEERNKAARAYGEK